MYPDGEMPKLKIYVQLSTLLYNVLNGNNLCKTYEDRILKIKPFKGRHGKIAATTSNVNNFNLNVNRLFMSKVGYLKCGPIFHSQFDVLILISLPKVF